MKAVDLIKLLQEVPGDTEVLYLNLDDTRHIHAHERGRTDVLPVAELVEEATLVDGKDIDGYPVKGLLLG